MMETEKGGLFVLRVLKYVVLTKAIKDSTRPYTLLEYQLKLERQTSTHTEENGIRFSTFMATFSSRL